MLFSSAKVNDLRKKFEQRVEPPTRSDSQTGVRKLSVGAGVLSNATGNKDVRMQTLHPNLTSLGKDSTMTQTRKYSSPCAAAQLQHYATPSTVTPKAQVCAVAVSPLADQTTETKREPAAPEPAPDSPTLDATPPAAGDAAPSPVAAPQPAPDCPVCPTLLLQSDEPPQLNEPTQIPEATDTKQSTPEKASEAPRERTAPRGLNLATAALLKTAATKKLQRARSAIEIKAQVLKFCTLNTAEYENIKIDNFSTSFADGLAFCALIHHFFPDAFDYSTLDASDPRRNMQLAFDTAQNRGSITPLLEIDDMIKYYPPDWKCVFTYVQFIYQKLRNHPLNKFTDGSGVSTGNNSLN